jgi:flagellin-like protein
MKLTNSIINKKKALSPVITTILLVLLAIVLAVIIFIWASSFIKEGLVKFGQPIEQACNDVKFDVSLHGGELLVTNTGDVPIYKLKAFSSSLGTSNSVELNQAISPGQSKSFSDVAAGSQIAPILLGNSKNDQINEFQCPKANWKTIE